MATRETTVPRARSTRSTCRNVGLNVVVVESDGQI